LEIETAVLSEMLTPGTMLYKFSSSVVGHCSDDDIMGFYTV